MPTDMRMPPRIRKPLILTAFLLATLLASGDSVQGALGIPDAAPAAIELQHTELRLTPGEKFRLRATVRNKEGESISGAVEWESLDLNLGVVDTAGWVTGLGDSGEFEVVARAGDVSARAHVELLPALRCRRPLSGEQVDVSIFGVQVLQAIEVAQPLVPPISRRPRTLRVSLLTDGPAPARLPASLEVAPPRGCAAARTRTPKRAACLPSTPKLAEWGATFNAEVPAAWVGGEMEFHVTAQVDAGGATQTELTYLEGGNGKYTVFEPQPFEVVFVPIALPKHEVTAEFAPERTAELVLHTRTLFPLDEVNASIRAPFAYNHETSLADLLPLIRELRLLDASTAYYHALVPNALPSPGAAGMGYYRIPASWSLVGLPDADNGFQFTASGMTIAHELGHNFNLRHADCGGAGGAAPGYPYVDARTGTYGVNPHGIDYLGYLVQPEVADLMSYCGPRWISDRNFRAVLNYRRQNEKEDTALPQAAPTTVMLASGHTRGGALALRPAFTFEAAPRPPRSGEWRWQLLDEEDRVLREVPFAPDVVALPQPESALGFAFTVAVSQADLVGARRARVLDPAGTVVA